MDGMMDYCQRILSAICDFQKGKRKARRMVAGSAGRNRCSRNGNGHEQQIKNQKVNK